MKGTKSERWKKKSFLGYKIWYRDICYVGCAENPLKLWRDHSGPAYPLWLRQNRVSVGTAREIPREKDFLWQVYWPWLTRNAKEMLDLRRGLRRPCSSVPTFSQLTWIQCPIPLQSQKRQQTMQSAGIGFHSSLLCMWSFCEGHANSSVKHGATQTPCPHMFRHSLQATVF